MSGIVSPRYQNRQFASSRRKLGFVPTSTELNWTFFRRKKIRPPTFVASFSFTSGLKKLKISIIW
jgi:hypothetical protein